MKCPNRKYNLLCDIELVVFDKNMFECRNCGSGFEYYNGKLFDIESDMEWNLRNTVN